jgi:hypothetical protein
MGHARFRVRINQIETNQMMGLEEVVSVAYIALFYEGFIGIFVIYLAQVRQRCYCYMLRWHGMPCNTSAALIITNSISRLLSLCSNSTQ